MASFFVVSTPIGNLKDVTLRAIEVLKSVDLVLSEDTKTSKKLFQKYNIKTPLLSYHQHSSEKRVKEILQELKKGKNLALISEAGTPCISDPGSKLIERIRKELPQVKIIPISGPSALISALSVSGFSGDKFLFLGFLPSKRKRKKFFEEIKNSKYTVVLFESSHRILKTLRELKDFLGDDLEVFVAREMTKIFESFYFGNISEVIEKIEKDSQKGEFVIVIKR